jgi:hypothetical protein
MEKISDMIRALWVEQWLPKATPLYSPVCPVRIEIYRTIKKPMNTSPRTIAMGMKVKWFDHSYCVILMLEDGEHWSCIGGDTGG